VGGQYYSPTLASGAAIGYDLGGQMLWENAPTDPGAGDGLSFLHFDASIAGAPFSGAPEPEGWALMLVGLGLAGASVRRRRAQGAVPAGAARLS
jgi:hypothetical protein